MLRFVFQKLWNKRWMVFSLLLGNLLMIAIATAAPTYSQAAMQRALTRSLSDYLIQNDKEPGIIEINGVYTAAGQEKEADFHRTMEGSRLLNQMVDELGVPEIQRVTHYYKGHVSAKPDVLEDGIKMSKSVRLSSYSDVQQHIQITNGEMFSNQLDGATFDVIVPMKTFIDQKLILGMELELLGTKNEEGLPYRVRVVGIFSNSQAQDPYWLDSPNRLGNLFLMDQDLFCQLFANENTLHMGFGADWYSVLDYSQIKGAKAEAYLSIVDTYEKTVDEHEMELTVSFQTTLEEFIPRYQKLNTTIWILLLPIFVLLAAFVFMVSRQMLEMEENEISVYKSRGASKEQILLIYLLQSAYIVGGSLIIGIPSGLLICKVLGASNSFLEFVKRTAMPLEVGAGTWLAAGIAALFSVCTMVLPVFRYANVNIVAHKRQKNRVNTRSWWQVICLDLMLLACAGYGLYQYNQQKEYLAQQVLKGASLDPLLYICSSLFMLGMALLFLRLFPWLMKGIFWLGRKWWNPALYASFLRIIRTKSSQGFLMVLLILTVAMGIYNAQTARSINANAEEKLSYITGADIVLQENWFNGSSEEEEGFLPSAGEDAGLEAENRYTEPDFGKYQTMPGVKNVTKVLVNDRIRLTVDGGSLEGVTLMGIHTKEFGETAWFRESLLPDHYHVYLNTISQNPRAILVSANFRDIYGYEVGDVLYYSDADREPIRGIIYDFVEYWPSYAPVTLSEGTDGVYRETDNFLIVAHLAQIQSSWGVTPYQVWIDAEDSTQFIYDYIEQSGIQCDIFRDSAAQLIEVKNDPVFQGTNGILTVGFICILLLSSIGFLIYWVLSIQSRTLQFGIFRAMGMSTGEVFSMLINEQIFITGLSLAVGVLTGVLTAKLFVPLVQMAYSSADQVIPMEIISHGGDYVRLFAVIGAAILLCMGVLGTLVSKIKIAQALKLGED